MMESDFTFKSLEHPVTIRIRPHLAKRLESLMRQQRIKKLSKGINTAIDYGCTSHEIVVNCNFIAPTPEDPKLHNIIDNLSIQEKKRLAELLAQKMGPEEVKRLRDLNNNNNMDSQ